jgi:hypothetical protein
MDPAKFTIKEGIEKPGFVMTKLWETTAQDTVRFYNNKGDLVDLKNESRYTEVESFFKFQSTRVRWFFVSIASCDPGCSNPKLDVDYSDGTVALAGADTESAVRQYCSSQMDVTYELSFTNSKDSRSKHFSANEMGSLETYVTVFCLQVGLLCMAGLISWALLKQGKFHHTVRLLDASVIIQWFSIMSFLAYWAEYGHSGRGWLAGFTPSSMVFGYFFQAVADTLLMLQCLLICKGWTIVRTKISANGRVKLAIFTTLYAWIWIIAVGWNLYIVKHLDVVFFYDCLPGRLLIAMRFIAAAWLYRCTRATLLHYASKKRFLKRFTYVYMTWLVGTPVAAMIANRYIDEWVRQKAVLLVELGFMFCAQTAMVLMYNPSQSYNRNFPFHRMTTDFQRELMAPRKKKWGAARFGAAAENHNPKVLKKSPVNGTTKEETKQQMKKKLTNEEKAHEMAGSVSQRLANWRALSETLEKDLVEMGASKDYDISDTSTPMPGITSAGLGTWSQKGTVPVTRDGRRVRSDSPEPDIFDRRDRRSQDGDRERRNGDSDRRDGDRDGDRDRDRHRGNRDRDHDRDRDRDSDRRRGNRDRDHDAPLRPTDRDFR